MKFEGKVWVLGDDVDTDVIISGKYLRAEDPKEWSVHVFEVLAKDYSSKIKLGDIIVAGRNFGCGSSREQAAIAIKEIGISVILAESFGRIFFRNAINIGLPVVICPQIKGYSISDGDTISVDLEKGEAKFKENVLSIQRLPDFMTEILRAGGLINYYNKLEAKSGTI
jgi:3-isopropylmalate dehydratase small subunit